MYLYNDPINEVNLCHLKVFFQALMFDVFFTLSFDLALNTLKHISNIYCRDEH